MIWPAALVRSTSKRLLLVGWLTGGVSACLHVPSRVSPSIDGHVISQAMPVRNSIVTISLAQTGAAEGITDKMCAHPINRSTTDEDGRFHFESLYRNSIATPFNMESAANKIGGESQATLCIISNGKPKSLAAIPFTHHILDRTRINVTCDLSKPTQVCDVSETESEW
jgi:hypothetical protein